METSQYARLLTELTRRGVRYVLCGGLALVLRQLKRDTFDADIAIDMEPDNVARFLQVITELGWSPRQPVPAAEFADAGKRAEWAREKGAIVFTFIKRELPFLALDIFLDPPISFADMHSAATPIKLGGVDVPLASYETLLEMKSRVQPPRAKDALDIIILKKVLSKRVEGD